MENAQRKTRLELDATGRLQRIGPFNYLWDRAGNLMVIDGAGKRAEHVFDAAGRMLRRSLPGGQWQFGYLPDGDRLWQEGPKGRHGMRIFRKDWPDSRIPRESIGWWVRIPGTDWPRRCAAPMARPCS